MILWQMVHIFYRSILGVSLRYLSNSRSKRKLTVGRFDRKSLHQPQNCCVADEDLRCRNVLLLTSFFAA